MCSKFGAYGRISPGQKVKGQGHTVMRTVRVARLLVKCAAAAGVGLHVGKIA